jgi:signal transduction histidine kinase
VAFGIRDTGPGIPSELRPRIFERFVKGPGSPGSGLGLAIAKDVVSAHGGSIEAITDPGNGTEIRFTLPVAR